MHGQLIADYFVDSNVGDLTSSEVSGFIDEAQQTSSINYGGQE